MDQPDQDLPCTWQEDREHYCRRCVNSSCPMNAVSKRRVDAYLRRNPAMREAWERAGYCVDDEKEVHDV